MKKFIALFVATIIMTSQVMAAAVSVELDGETVEFSAQQPIIQDGRTLIPLRGVFEKLGYNVEWKADTKTAVLSKGSSSVEVTAGADTMLVDKDELFTLDVPAQIINGSMMLPLRAIGEASGLEVNWDSATKTVSISTGAKEQGAAPVSAVPEEDLKKIKAAVRAEYEYMAILYCDDAYADEIEYCDFKIAGAASFSNSEKELKDAFESALSTAKKYKSIAQAIDCGDESKAIRDKFVEYLDADMTYYEFERDYLTTKKYDSMSDEEITEKTNELANALLTILDELDEEYGKCNDFCINVIDDERYNDDPTDSKLTPEQKAEKEKYFNAVLPTVNNSLKFIADSDDFPEDYAQYKKAADTIRAKVNSTEAPVFCTVDREVLLQVCDRLEDASEAVKAGALNDTEYGAESIKFEYSIFYADFSLYNVFVDDYKSILDGSDIEIEEDILDNVEMV